MNRLIDAISADVRSNRWYCIEEYHLDAYIRISTKYLSGIFVNTIELANIKVDDEHQQKGYFSDFLRKVEDLAVQYGRIVYVESIMNPHLKAYLSRHKYVSDSHDPNSLYKII